MLNSFFSFARQLKSMHLVIIAAMILCIAAPSEAFGQTRSKGSSSTKRSKPSSSSKPTSKGWGSKDEKAAPTKSAEPAKKTTSSDDKVAEPVAKPKKSADRATETKKPVNKAEQAMYEKAKKQGTLYKSRDEAVSAFKAKQGEQLKKQYPSSYASEPPSRPEHIPSTFTPAGSSQPVKIDYNSQTGGYSWFNTAVGAYIVYDILSDDKAVAAQMAKTGYAYGPAPTSSGGQIGLLMILVFIAIIAVFAMVIFMANRRKTLVPDISMESSSSPSSPLRVNNPKKAIAQTDGLLDVLLNPEQHSAANNDETDGRLLSTSDPEFWRDLRPGSIARITDLSALQESLSEGKGADGEEYTVKWIYQIDELGKLSEWIFVKMTSVEDEDVFVLAFICDGELSLYVYYSAGGFVEGSRADALENGQEWLFIEPSDTEQIDPLKLKYTEQFDYELTNDDESSDNVTYKMKPLGVMQGMAYRNPCSSRMLTTIAMYSTDADCHSPEALIMEMGAPDSGSSLISLYLGETLQPAEIQIHHA